MSTPRKRTATTTAALYLRQSLDRDGAGLAVERQETECRELCARLGFDVGAVFVDNDTSATSGVTRPGFEALLAARPAVVVAWHQDRLLRLSRDLERVIDLDVPVYTVTAGTLDLSTPAGRAVARTVAAWSQYETEQKSTRQKAAHRQRAAAGRPWSTRRPFGFKADAMTHDRKEVAVIRRMYRDLLAGESQAAITRDLNARGIMTTEGNPWRQSSVRALLANPRNAGLIAHNGEIVGPAAWAPIVDETTWRAAQARMQPTPGRGKGGARKYLLTGLAVCGVCGVPVRVMQSATGRRLYACPQRHVGRDGASVDDLVTAVILRRLAKPDAARLLVDDDVSAAAAVAAEARAALDELAAAFGAGEMTPAAFRLGSAKAAERLRDAEAAMTASRSGTAVASLIGAADVAAAWRRLSLAHQRAIVRLLVTVAIDRTVRGAQWFRPEDVRVEWKGAG